MVEVLDKYISSHDFLARSSEQGGNTHLATNKGERQLWILPYDQNVMCKHEKSLSSAVNYEKRQSGIGWNGIYGIIELGIKIRLGEYPKCQYIAWKNRLIESKEMDLYGDMCVCVSVCMWVCLYLCIYIRTSADTYTNIYIYIYTKVDWKFHLLENLYDVCLCVCMHVGVSEFMKIYSHKHTHIYTYIYIYIQRWIENLICWKAHMMLSYLLLTFLTSRIQAMQHQWTKCVNCKKNYAEK